MAKSRTRAKADKAEIVGRKNLIINGAMQVAQRGTSFDETFGGVDKYCLDRFKTPVTTAYITEPQYTVSQGNGNPEAGFNKSIKIQVDVAGSGGTNRDVQFLGTKLEAHNLSSLGWGSSNPKDAVLSFYIKSSVVGTYGFFIYNPTSGNQFVTSYTVDSANVWERKEVLVPGDTGGVNSNGTSEGVRIEFRSDCTGTIGQSGNDTAWGPLSGFRSVSDNVSIFGTAGNVVEVTGVQLELGPVATDFEHRSYGEELALCQRYYEKLGTSTSNIVDWPATLYTNASAYTHVPFSVTKRVAPTVTAEISSVYSNGASRASYPTTNVRNIRNSGVNIYTAGVSGGTSGHAALFYFWLEADAEL